MGVNLIFKIAAVGILVSVMCQVLKHSGREDQAAQLKPLKPEYAVYLVLAASIGVGFLGLARLGVLLDTLREIGNGIRIRHVYLAALLKMAGITYIAEFTSGICKDAGYSAVGTQVEMVGKLAILAVSAPVVLSLVETLKVFME